MIRIFWNENLGGTPPMTVLRTLDVHPDDESYCYRAIMEKPQLVLKFSLAEFKEIPVGAWCDFQNHRYFVRCPEDIKKNGERNIEYQLTMHDNASLLSDYKMRNTVDRRLKFSMCATPQEFLQEIVNNLNERDGGGTWAVGSYIEATEKTVEFNHCYLDEALQSVADAFDTEWEITEDYKINLGKVEHNIDSPVPLSYGRGNGFVPGVGRVSEMGEKPVKRLYVQGSDRNIDRSKYGGAGTDFPEYATTSAELRLPPNQTIRYDGKHFEDEEGFDAASAKTYGVDADGYYIERLTPVNDAVKEDSLDCSEIYPSYVGQITEVAAEVDGDENLYDFIDANIPASLNFCDYLIGDEDMTVIFQSGMLAGREFGVKYHHDDKRFEIVPADMDGTTMPNATFKPKQTDKYAVFNIMLPPAYFRDNIERSGASWDMLREAVKYLYEHEQQKFTFSGELQGKWAKDNWETYGGMLIPGGYVRFTDNQFATEGVNIRIKGIKTFINSPYSPTIELSNNITAGSYVMAALRDAENAEVIINDSKRESISYTKRRFRDAKETMAMLGNALASLGDAYSDAINPIAVKTMQMLLGDESLQFQFIRSLGWGRRVPDTFAYSSLTKQITTKGTSYIQHLTIGIGDISSKHKIGEYLRWQLPAYTSPVLDVPDKNYYVYAVVRKPQGETQDELSETTGYFTLSENALDLVGTDNGGNSCYNLLCGVLNKEYDGERSFVSLYGFTEILPGRITTDRVVSGDGESYFDMVANAFRLGEHLQYNVDGSHQLKLKGTIMQSPSGDEFYVPCYRGMFSLTTQYYTGDTVSFTSGGGTSTYICIYNTIGRAPTDDAFWKLLSSQGTDGKEIASITQLWKRTSNGTKPAATDSDWSENMLMPTVSAPYLWVKTTYNYTSGDPDVTITLSAVKGNTGSKGDTGAAPALVYRGDYDPSAIYYGYSKRLDCVRFGSTYYVAVLNDTIGTTGFTGKQPDNTSYWANFGASFESVATNLLLADMANVGGWILKEDRLISQTGEKQGAVSNDYANADFVPSIILDAVNGEVRQGDNICINRDGMTVFDDEGNVSAKIISSSIGQEVDLSEMTATKIKSYSDEPVNLTNPYDNSTATTTVGKTYDLGYFISGGTIRFIAAIISLTLPTHDTATITYSNVSFKVQILRDSAVVKEIAMTGSYGSLSPGSVIRGDASAVTTLNIDGNEYMPGNYSIRICCTLTHTATNASGGATLSNSSLYTECRYYFNKNGLKKTLIGSDGIFTCWGSNQYIFANSDGITLRHGNHIFKLGSQGIQYSNDGGATDFNTL